MVSLSPPWLLLEPLGYPGRSSQPLPHGEGSRGVSAGSRQGQAAACKARVITGQVPAVPAPELVAGHRKRQREGALTWVCGEGCCLGAHSSPPAGCQAPAVSPAKLSHPYWGEFIASAPLSGLLLGNYPYTLCVPLQTPWEPPANARSGPGPGCAPLHLPSQLCASQFRAGEALWGQARWKGTSGALCPHPRPLPFHTAADPSVCPTLKVRGRGRALNHKQLPRGSPACSPWALEL